MAGLLSSRRSATSPPSHPSRDKNSNCLGPVHSAAACFPPPFALILQFPCIWPLPAPVTVRFADFCVLPAVLKQGGLTMPIQFRQVTDGAAQVQPGPPHLSHALAQVSRPVFQVTTPMTQVKPTGHHLQHPPLHPTAGKFQVRKTPAHLMNLLRHVRPPTAQVRPALRNLSRSLCQVKNSGRNRVLPAAPVAGRRIWAGIV